ncbi:MAG: aminoglycoside phosphotransferase family protein [Lachnospiraceae bacterium]|jgi:Ser/Thr protein kinase RdoA (MazF antagonist)|nr:aminoglycoside phosphotransferase family protein [Lachnospiraceae bacterium]
MEQHIVEKAVEIISAKALNISVEARELYRKHNRFMEYLLDDKYILRISEQELPEQSKNYRVNSLSLVAKIHSSGSYTVTNQKYHYLLFDYLKGDELWHVAPMLTDKEQEDMGKEIAQFLNELHLLTDEYYDIGHYIPTIPRWKKSWKEGHLEYALILKNDLQKIDLTANGREAISKAFDYIYTNIHSLEYQGGAKLLHNDFHLKNIIVREGRIIGVIDWECSQFGEADFELSRLFDWCVYPENYLTQTNNLRTLLKSVIENLHFTSVIPEMEKRMTIYQLEHELNQLIWNGKDQEEERVIRVNEWLAGKVLAFLEE